MKEVVVKGQSSWCIESESVRASVTKKGGMMAPVSFKLVDNQWVEPYYISPWCEENTYNREPLLGSLRGDFFCLPFGADNRTGEEDHPCHGESASSDWSFVSEKQTETGKQLSLMMDYTSCSGHMEKELTFSDLSPAIYTEHRLTGFNGAYPLGHHAILKGGGEGLWKIFTSPFDFGQVSGGPDRLFLNGEYYSLEPGAAFDKLDRVSTRWKSPEYADISVFPSREGFVDIAAIYRNQTVSEKQEDQVTWIMAVNRKENYLWFSLKNRNQLPATVFWMENRGRHHTPWCGRNSCIGIEETCSFFASGRKESIIHNHINSRGIKTAVQFNPEKEISVRTIQGVTDYDMSNGSIRNVQFSDQKMVITTDTDHKIEVAVSWKFLCSDL